MAVAIEALDLSGLQITEHDIPALHEETPSGVVHFFSRVLAQELPGQDTDLMVLARYDANRGEVALLDRDFTSQIVYDMAIPTAREQGLLRLAMAEEPSEAFGRIDLDRNFGVDQRNGHRKAYEKSVSEWLPYNIRREMHRAVNPTGEDNEELVETMRDHLFGENGLVMQQAGKFAAAEKKKAELILAGKDQAAANVRTVDTILTQMEPDVAFSLRVLACGDKGRLTQLVSEHQALEAIRLKREQMLRTVGEYHLLISEGVTKAALATSHIRAVDEIGIDQILTDEQRAQARNKVSPQFGEAAERFAAATELANRELIERGRAVFTVKRYQTALAIHENAIEGQMAEAHDARVRSGELSKDAEPLLTGLFYDNIQLVDGHLADPTMSNMEGRPFTWWQELPVVPLLMKKDDFQEGNTPDIISENIMAMLESSQVSNHGAHVAISDEVRADIVGKIRKAVEAGEPVKLDMYYTIARMGNPLEGLRRMPGHQDWAMMYKMGQVAETAKLFYQPADGQPAMQWIIINEAEAFKDVWDLPDHEVEGFALEMDAMIDRMGLSNVISRDSLQRMAEEGGAPVWEFVEANYKRIRANWDAYAATGLDWDSYVEQMGDRLDKTARGDVRTILDREVSMMRLVNPLRNYPDMTIDDLLAVYNGIMPNVELEDVVLTDRQAEILATVRERGLHANIYSKALMDARTMKLPDGTDAIKRREPKAISVTITDKENKLVVHSADPRTKAFMGHGEEIVRYTRVSSPGSPEAGRPWYDVDRAIGILAQWTVRDGKRVHRYVGIVDPTDSTGIPYMYLEVPTQPDYKPTLKADKKKETN